MRPLIAYDVPGLLGEGVCSRDSRSGGAGVTVRLVFIDAMWENNIGIYAITG